MDVTISESNGWWHMEETNDPYGGPMFDTLTECADYASKFARVRVRILPGWPLARWWAEQEGR